MKIKVKDGTMYCRAGSLWFRVAAMLTNIESANDYMELNPDESLLVVRGEVHIVAETSVKGVKSL